MPRRDGHADDLSSYASEGPVRPETHAACGVGQARVSVDGCAARGAGEVRAGGPAAELRTRVRQQQRHARRAGVARLPPWPGPAGVPELP